MSTRRRIGISIATTEAARRQLMQPVVCWEKQWVSPGGMSSSALKVHKWVRTERKQQFSDDEGEVDEPLAPLPDEPEVVEGDEDVEQDEVAPSVAPEAEADPETVEPSEMPSEPQTKPPSPTPPTLSLEPTAVGGVTEEETSILDPTTVEGMDMAALGPDGTSFEGVNDLTQMEGGDDLLGVPIMDTTDDPFATSMEMPTEDEVDVTEQLEPAIVQSTTSP